MGNREVLVKKRRRGKGVPWENEEREKQKKGRKVKVMEEKGVKGKSEGKRRKERDGVKGRERSEWAW